MRGNEASVGKLDGRRLAESQCSQSECQPSSSEVRLGSDDYTRLRLLACDCVLHVMCTAEHERTASTLQWSLDAAIVSTAGSMLIATP